MKPRAKWLSEILSHTKSGRHQDKRMKRRKKITPLELDELHALKEYKRRKKEYDYGADD